MIFAGADVVKPNRSVIVSRKKTRRDEDEIQKCCVIFCLGCYALCYNQVLVLDWFLRCSIAWRQFLTVECDLEEFLITIAFMRIIIRLRCTSVYYLNSRNENETNGY